MKISEIMSPTNASTQLEFLKGYVDTLAKSLKLCMETRFDAIEKQVNLRFEANDRATKLAYDNMQKQYFDYLMGLKETIVGAFWYTLANNGWENSDMINRGSPKQVWYRYQETLI